MGASNSAFISRWDDEYSEEDLRFFNFLIDSFKKTSDKNGLFQIKKRDIVKFLGLEEKNFESVLFLVYLEKLLKMGLQEISKNEKGDMVGYKVISLFSEITYCKEDPNCNFYFTSKFSIEAFLDLQRILKNPEA